MTGRIAISRIAIPILFHSPGIRARGRARVSRCAEAASTEFGMWPSTGVDAVSGALKSARESYGRSKTLRVGGWLRASRCMLGAKEWPPAKFSPPTAGHP